MKENILKNLLESLKENKINAKDIDNIEIKPVDFNTPKFMKFKKAIIKAGLISSIGLTTFAPVSLFTNNNFGIIQEVSAKTVSTKLVNVKFKNKKVKKNKIINVSNEKAIKLSVPKKSTVKVTLNKKNKSSIAKKIKKNQKVKFSKLGKYKVKVSLKNKKSLTFYVKSKDTTKPVITMNGQSKITLEQFEACKIPTVSAKDNVDGNITKKINIDVEKDSLYYTDLTEQITNGEEVKFFNPGIYNIIYSVTDKAGNKTEKKRVITVVKPKEKEETTEKTPQNTTESPSNNQNTTETPNNENGFYYLGELDGKKYYRDDNYFLYYDENNSKIAVIITDYRVYDNDWKIALQKYNDSLNNTDSNEVAGNYLGENDGTKYYCDENYYIFHVAEDGSYIYDLVSDYRQISSDWKEALGLNKTTEDVKNNYLGEVNNIKYYYDENCWIYHIDAEGKNVYDLTSDYRQLSSDWKEALGLDESNTVVNEYYYLGEMDGESYYRDNNYFVYYAGISIGTDENGNEVEYNVKVPVVLSDYRKYDSDWKVAIEKYNNSNENEEDNNITNESENYLGEIDGIKYYSDEDYWIYHKDENDNRIYDFTSDYRQVSNDWKESLVKDTSENVKKFVYLGEYDSVNYYSNEKNWICYYTIIDSELTPVYIITTDYTQINSNWKTVVENYYETKSEELNSNSQLKTYSK